MRTVKTPIQAWSRAGWCVLVTWMEAETHVMWVSQNWTNRCGSVWELHTFILCFRVTLAALWCVLEKCTAWCHGVKAALSPTTLEFMLKYASSSTGLKTLLQPILKNIYKFFSPPNRVHWPYFHNLWVILLSLTFPCSSLSGLWTHLSFFYMISHTFSHILKTIHIRV